MPIEANQIYALLKSPTGASVVVGYAPEPLRLHLGAKHHVIYLSRGTLIKNQDHHPSITPYDLIWTPEIIRCGAILAEPPPSKSAVVTAQFDASQKIYKVVVKLAESGHDMWLSTFHRLEPRQFDRLLAKSTIIRPALRRL